MKVKDLMERLKEFDGNAEVNIGDEGYVNSDIRVEPTWDGKILICDWCYYDDVDSIEAQNIIAENNK